eukprot:TRINITY_DN17574_c0_g1_i2.p1 TRINITY_DN17574_c0_g1~~TRINITY_DN17574_c0_g1_i2.p1  ORF type:complete len:321 (-),score=44.65 TRINITY_DN17574_c0_g1_i2:43-1005(-)
MKLDYKILWLDDKIEDFKEDEYVEEIENYLKQEEFNPIIHTTNDQLKFFEYLRKDNYDLILTDFHLNEKKDNTNSAGKEINGDDIVEKVRQKHIFTEILFYTAKAELEGKLKWDRISFLETEQFGKGRHHEKVVEKIINLINLNIEKFHDIVVMRGMIMNETSDLDAQKIELLNNFIQSEKYIDKIPQLRTRLFTEISSFLKEKTAKIDKCIRTNNLDKLISDTVLFSADKKISAMSEILQMLGQIDFSDDYKEEIIKVRNNFAHVVLDEEKDENEKVIRKFFKDKKNGITFDTNYCKTIRLNINKHKKNLDKLEQKLNE